MIPEIFRLRILFIESEVTNLMEREKKEQLDGQGG